MILEGLGRITSPLGTIRLNGITKLVVAPWAALGTDALLVTTGIATYCLTKSTWLKILGGAGAAWGTLAATVEILKLVEVIPSVSADIVRE